MADTIRRINHPDVPDDLSALSADVESPAWWVHLDGKDWAVTLRDALLLDAEPAKVVRERLLTLLEPCITTDTLLSFEGDADADIRRRRVLEGLLDRWVQDALPFYGERYYQGSEQFGVYPPVATLIYHAHQMAHRIKPRQGSLAHFCSVLLSQLELLEAYAAHHRL